MTIEAPPTSAVGNPVQRATLLRAMRSNSIAAILTGWTVLIAAVGAVVLGDQIGYSHPFKAAPTDGPIVGLHLGQWWVVTVVAGMAVLMAVLGCTMSAAQGERRRLAAWNATLVRPGRVALGLWKSQLALGALALALTLPVAGIAYGLGGTTLTQLGIGLAGAAVAGASTSAFAIAVSCRSRGVLRPLVVCLVVLAGLFVGPVIAHQARGAPESDPVLVVVPIVAVADAAVPHAALRSCVADASFPVDCSPPPLTRMYGSVEPTSGTVPLWGFAAIGAAAVTVGSLLAARFRLARPSRH